jgi:hypothetical protein
MNETLELLRLVEYENQSVCGKVMRDGNGEG